MFTETPEPVTIRPVRSIDAFTAYVVLDETGTDELEITEHPVQEGAVVADHAYLKPTTLGMRVVFGDDLQPLEETYAQLLDLQALREPIDVVTGKRIYRSMLIRSLACTTDPTTENILAVSLALKEIIIVQVEVSSVPPRAKQAQPAKTGGTQNAGAKSAQPDTSKNTAKRQESILKSGSKIF
jgi:hypothetical protein